MFISLNIILDSISHYRYEHYIDMPTVKTFRRISLLPRDIKKVRPDCLYICRLSDVIRETGIPSEVYRMCVRDRISDAFETMALLSGTIIINENLELDQLFMEVQNTFVLINDWYQNMLEAVIQQKSMQDIITLSEPVIGNFISISDTALTLQAYTKNITTDDPTQLSLVKHGYHTEEAIQKFKKFKRFEAWMNTEGVVINSDHNISQYDIISRVFTFNEIYFEHVVMMCDHRKLTPGLVDLFNHMVDILSYYIKRNWEESKNCDHMYNSLILNLVQRKINNRDTLNERARIVGLRADDEYIVMLLSCGSSSDSISPRLMALDISKIFPRIRTVYYNSRLMLFLNFKNITQLMTEQDMEKKLNSYFHAKNVYCGVSEIFNDLLEMPAAYSQAELALNKRQNQETGAQMIWDSVDRCSNISSFSTIFADCMLDTSECNKQLWKNWKYGKKLIELYQADLEKNTNNLEVLYTFLMHERRAAETAALLHMHRNNVAYRISRIEELLDLSLEDMTTRQNLIMSYMMLKGSGLLQSIKNTIV